MRVNNALYYYHYAILLHYGVKTYDIKNNSINRLTKLQNILQVLASEYRIIKNNCRGFNNFHTQYT
jgi:hypothetical protein